jgi:hypothetical protein
MDDAAPNASVDLPRVDVAVQRNNRSAILDTFMVTLWGRDQKIVVDLFKKTRNSISFHCHVTNNSPCHRILHDPAVNEDSGRYGWLNLGLLLKSDIFSGKIQDRAHFFEF